MVPPEKLGHRGTRLWEAISNEVKLDAAGDALLEEICRTADIIDRLSGILRSSKTDWLELVENSDTDSNDAVEIHIIINPVVGEIRQQRLALRTMMAHLKIGAVKGGDSESKKFWTEMESQFDGS